MAEAEDPALKNLSELEKELGTPRKARKTWVASDHHDGGSGSLKREDRSDPRKKKKKRGKARDDSPEMSCQEHGALRC